MPLLLSLTLGLAVWLVYDGLVRPGRPGPAQPARWLRLRDALVRAGVHDVGPREFALFSLGAGGLCFLMTQLALGWPLVSLLAAALGLTAPTAYYAGRHARQRAATQAALVEAIGQLRNAIRAGLSVQEALAGLARHGPEPLRPEFAALVRDIRLRGFAPALEGFQDRFADPLVDTIVAALALNDTLGGRNIGQVLDQLEAATRAELRVQEELRAYQARTVYSARVIAALPLAVLAGVRALNHDYLAVFDSAAGQLVLVGCLLSTAVGYTTMIWLTRLPAQERVLR